MGFSSVMSVNKETKLLQLLMDEQKRRDAAVCGWIPLVRNGLKQWNVLVERITTGLTLACGHNVTIPAAISKLKGDLKVHCQKQMLAKVAKVGGPQPATHTITTAASPRCIVIVCWRDERAAPSRPFFRPTRARRRKLLARRSSQRCTSSQTTLASSTGSHRSPYRRHNTSNTSNPNPPPTVFPTVAATAATAAPPPASTLCIRERVCALARRTSHSPSPFPTTRRARPPTTRPSPRRPSSRTWPSERRGESL
jgi:hypothetical protein